MEGGGLEGTVVSRGVPLLLEGPVVILEGGGRESGGGVGEVLLVWGRISGRD